LRLQRELNLEQPIEIVSTFLGAHVLPAEYRSKADGAQQYVALLTDRLIPEVAAEKAGGILRCFCDRGAFSRKDSKIILEAARNADWCANSCEQLTRTGAAQLAVQLGAASCDHLEQVSKADVRALAESKTVATLCLAAIFILD